VTEAVTSLDLVKLQIRIAAGEKLPFAQGDVSMRGHAIECRIYAEDPDNNFFPSPGKILDCRVPTGPGIRMDDGVYIGWTVPNDYDPLLGKLIAWGSDRAEAIHRLRRALDEYYASGIKTNLTLVRRILASRDFQNGDIYTRWLDDFLLLSRNGRASKESEDSQSARNGQNAAILAAALWQAARSGAQENVMIQSNNVSDSRWKSEGRREQLDREPRRSSTNNSARKMNDP
jgi:acetyl-CoA carboxylase biotin carboxylase subunit